MRLDASDPDGGPLRYSWSEGAGKGRFSAPDGTGDSTWWAFNPPSFSPNGDYNCVFKRFGLGTHLRAHDYFQDNNHQPMVISDWCEVTDFSSE